MPRIRRVCPPGVAQHVLNRGNDRRRIFHKSGDYRAFLRLMAEAQEHTPLAILAYCLMPNHFHLVVLPESTAALSAYMHRLMNTHLRQYHQHYGSCGMGHIYQGRYKNFPVQTDRHLLNVLRYVEGNPLRARLVGRAEFWGWSSLSIQRGIRRPTLTECPVGRPAPWVDYVNGGTDPGELTALRRSVQRGAPYGDEVWSTRIAKAHGLEFTLRNRGRQKGTLNYSELLPWKS